MHETYIIQANPGAGNHFFISLIVHLCRQETVPISFNNRGNSHDYAFNYLSKSTNEPITRKTHDRSEWIYNYEVNPDSTDPLVVLYEPWATPVIDYKRLQEKHPTIKYLFVDVDDEDIIRAVTYHFIKQTVYDNTSKEYVKITINMYNDFAKNHSSIRQNIVHPMQFNLE